MNSGYVLKALNLSVQEHAYPTASDIEPLAGCSDLPSMCFRSRLSNKKSPNGGFIVSSRSAAPTYDRRDMDALDAGQHDPSS